MEKTKEIIQTLNLKPHPEGGHYRQTFKDDVNVYVNDGTSRTRAAVTDIYFLLTKGEKSRFHRVKQTEIWHFYEGAPMTIYDISEDFKTLNIVKLGEDSNYKYVINANHYQAAVTSGDFSLIGCTVAPGFEFEDFALLCELPDLALSFQENFPELKHLL